MGERNTKNLVVLETTIIEEDYNISLNCPKKRDLISILEDPSHRISAEVTFTDGILSTVSHSFKLHIFRDGGHPNLGLYVHLSPKTKEIVLVNSVRANFIGDDDTTEEASLYPSTQPVDHTFADCEYYEYNYRWPDNTRMIYITVQISRRNFPSVQEDEDQPHSTSTTELTQLHGGFVNTAPLFLAEDFSDVVIECSGEVFPAHRLILAAKSDYFRSMFHVPLKESLENRVELTDIEPPVLKEFLRFIYTGQVDQDILTDMSTALYVAADKYNVEELLLLCESNLLLHVNLDNAMAMYDLSQNRPKSKLTKKAREIIAWNKDKFAADAESFKNFTCKYPELMFEIFKL